MTRRASTTALAGARALLPLADHFELRRRSGWALATPGGGRSFNVADRRMPRSLDARGVGGAP